MADTHHPVRWADGAMFEAAPMKAKVPHVSLVSATSDPLGAIAAACRMYKGIPTYSLSEVTDDERRQYWLDVQKTELKAPLEFVDMHFFIEGVTRSLTHQMVRQRTAVYAQESMRFAVKDLSQSLGLPTGWQSWTTDQKDAWNSAMANIDETYKFLVNNGIPGEVARDLLPHATLTRLNYKTNLRNLVTEAGKRLCTQAQFPWRMVFAGIRKSIHDHQPNGWQWELIASDHLSFSPVCYQKGKCGFKAEFDRGCTIRERVDQFEENGVPSSEWHKPYYSSPYGPDEVSDTAIDPIDPREWMLDSTAGFVE